MGGVEQNLRTSVSVYVFSFVHGQARFLTLLRAPHLRLAGTWQAVHGRVHDGEKAYDAALREMQEETGLRPDRFFRLDFVELFYNEETDAVHVIPAFAAHVPNLPRPELSDEHTDFEWCDLDETLSRFVWPSQRKAVQLIADGVAPWPETSVELHDITGYLGGS